ncbi:MAG TPA: AAA family ATPase [Acidobacteriaceae bacterium]|nr:AAA family ATPase [Acidobacteriaceae bacterium]
MINTLAISGYRSIRDLRLPLSNLNMVTGANGSGKSSLYRALRLLGDAAQNSVVASLAREGGLTSTLWAGPEIIGRSVRKGEHPVEGTVRQKPVALKLGFAGDVYGYSIELGYPPPPPPTTMFDRDPAIKRECIWHGAVYNRHASLVDRNNNLVTATGDDGDEPAILTQNLSAADSMLTSVPDPIRAPEMLEVREAIRRWRFYDGFRTDVESPVRFPRIGTFTPVLSNDGTDLAAALQTILEIGEDEALRKAIDDAFPAAGSA